MGLWSLWVAVTEPDEDELLPLQHTAQQSPTNESRTGLLQDHFGIRHILSLSPFRIPHLFISLLPSQQEKMNEWEKAE